MKNTFGGRGGGMGGAGRGRGGGMFGGKGEVKGGAGRGGGGGTRPRFIFRTRVVGVPATPQDPVSYSSTSSPTLSHKLVASNPFSLSSTLFLYTKKRPRWCLPPNGDDSEWVCVDKDENDMGAVPSKSEVDDAVSALQQVLGLASSDQVTETDWAEPSLSSYNSTALQANRFDRVYYAFHLLKTDPYVQRMVKSLSVDKAVWDAVLKNEVVRELRELISAGDQHDSGRPKETSNSDSFTTTNVVMRIFDTAKNIFMEVIEKITKIVNELFQPAHHWTRVDADGLDSLNDKLRSSFILCIMVLMVVVLNRAQVRA